MAMHRCQCTGCQHIFYNIMVDCREDEKVYCPLCDSTVEVSDIELPDGEQWAECHKKHCVGCKKNDRNDH